MSTLKPVVINGHGAKTNQKFEIKDHTLLTPEDLSIPYVFAIDPNYSIEKDFQQLQVKDIHGGHWKFYDQSHSPKVNEVSIGPWSPSELKTFAHNILTNPSYWSNIDNHHQYYLVKDPAATLVVKKGNQYLHLSSTDAQAFLSKVENGTYSSHVDGKALFFYADKIGKVKVFSETSLSEIMDQLNQISGPKLVMLATCNAGYNNKTVTYDIHSAKQDVTEIAKEQGIDLHENTAFNPEVARAGHINDFSTPNKKINDPKYIKLDTTNAFEKQNYYYGPLKKSLFTQELELLTKCLLKNPNDFQLNVSYDYLTGKNALHAKTVGIDINVSDLMKKANFTHLSFSELDCQLYDAMYHQNMPHYNSKGLSCAEKSALENYTGSGNYNVNNLMHGSFDKVSGSLKDTLIKSLFIGSGLNKIMPEAYSCKTYRGDKPDDAQVNERIDLIKKGGGTTDTTAFFSTSSNEYTAHSFSSKCIIKFDNCYGKSISWLSHFPGEKEYLLEPTKILWTGYEFDRGKHIFHAQKVVPLEGRPTETLSDKATFGKLMNWAKGHGIDTDFITPDLKASLEISKLESTAISIHDCLTMDTGKHAGDIITTSSAPASVVVNDMHATVDSLVTQIQHLDLNPPQFDG